MSDYSEGTHAKRKRYEPAVYARLLHELTELMDAVPKLEPDRNSWDIEGDWSSTGTIYYVDKHYQLLFAKLSEFDCRSIKLVNLDRPAVRITFFKRHRYWLLKEKDLPLEKKQELIDNYLADLTQRIYQLEEQFERLVVGKRLEASRQLAELRQQLDLWRGVEQHLDSYEMAVSNYARLHVYVTVNYKYRLGSGEYANLQEHLLNHQRDRQGNITQMRYNILFVDAEEILREHPYQNREVEGYLAGFNLQSKSMRHTLYARKRLVVESEANTE